VRNNDAARGFPETRGRRRTIAAGVLNFTRKPSPCREIFSFCSETRKSYIRSRRDDRIDSHRCEQPSSNSRANSINCRPALYRTSPSRPLEHASHVMQGSINSSTHVSRLSTLSVSPGSCIKTDSRGLNSILARLAALKLTLPEIIAADQAYVTITEIPVTEEPGNIIGMIEGNQGRN